MPKIKKETAAPTGMTSPSKLKQTTLFPGSPPTVVKKRRQPVSRGGALNRAKSTISSVDANVPPTNQPVISTAIHRLPLCGSAELVATTWRAACADMAMIIQSMEHRKGEGATGISDLRRLYETATGAADQKLAPLESRAVNLGKLNSARHKLCQSFAAICKELDKQKDAEAETGGLPGGSLRLPLSLLPRLLDQAYAQAVTQPKALNKYKPFSHEVYGETNCGLMQAIISNPAWSDNTNASARLPAVGPNDVFFDLGSGVGQVVLQVAATTGCRAYGIELMPAPAGYAEPLRDAFEANLSQWGYNLRNPVGFVHGSFLEDHGPALPLDEATFIFVNNYAFPVGLSHELGARIAKLCKPGTRVVSYKALVPLGRTRGRGVRVMAGERSLLEKGRHLYARDGVSWTSSAIEYIRYAVA